MGLNSNRLPYCWAAGRGTDCTGLSCRSPPAAGACQPCPPAGCGPAEPRQRAAGQAGSGPQAGGGSGRCMVALHTSTHIPQSHPQALGEALQYSGGLRKPSPKFPGTESPRRFGWRLRPASASANDVPLSSAAPAADSMALTSLARQSATGEGLAGDTSLTASFLPTLG